MEDKVKQALKYVEELKLICHEKVGAIRRLNAIEAALKSQQELIKEDETEIKTLIDKNGEMSTERNKARNESFKLKLELAGLRKFAKLFTKDRLHDGCRINNYDTNSVDWGLLFQISEDEYDFYNQEADKYGKEEN